MKAGVVLHDDFTCLVTFEGGERGNHAVHVTIHGETFNHFTPVGLEATIVVVEFDVNELAYGSIEHSAGENFVPWVMALLLVTGDDVVSLSQFF